MAHLANAKVRLSLHKKNVEFPKKNTVNNTVCISKNLKPQMEQQISPRKKTYP